MTTVMPALTQRIIMKKNVNPGLIIVKWAVPLPRRAIDPILVVGLR
jgi:hypothetical protein